MQKGTGSSTDAQSALQLLRQAQAGKNALPAGGKPAAGVPGAPAGGPGSPAGAAAPGDATALTDASKQLSAPGGPALEPAPGDEPLPPLWHLSPESEASYRKVEKGLVAAKSPDDLKELQAEADNLKANNPSTPDIGQLADKVRAASDALSHVNDLNRQLTGSPTDKAGAAAALLDGQSLGQTLSDLGPLATAPVGQAALTQLHDQAGSVTPQGLASQLKAQPDLTKYPPGTAAHVVAIVQAGEPNVSAVVPDMAHTLLNNGVSFQQVKDQPALGQVLGTLVGTPDEGKLAQMVGSWAKQSLDANLQGKEKPSGVKEALKGYQADMSSLANATGLGPLISQQAQQVAHDNKDELDKVAHKGESLLDKVGGFLGDALGDLTGGLSDIGKVAGGVLKVAGSAIDETVHLTGAVLATTSRIEGAVGGAVLNAVGAHGAAKFVQGTLNKYADGEQSFMDGAGAALGGTVTGVAVMASNPVQTVKALGSMVQHPERLVDVGKAIYKEATKGGAVYAAGYIAGELLPMVLSAGSSAGGDVAADVAAAGVEHVAEDGVVKGAEALGTHAAEEGAAKGAEDAAATGAKDLVAAGGRDAGKDLAAAADRNIDQALVNRLLDRDPQGALNALRSRGITGQAAEAKLAELRASGDVNETSLALSAGNKAKDMLTPIEDGAKGKVLGETLKSDVTEHFKALGSGRGMVRDLAKSGAKEAATDFQPAMDAFKDLAAHPLQAILHPEEIARAGRLLGQGIKADTVGLQNAFDLFAHGHFQQGTSVAMFGERGLPKVVAQGFRGAVALKNATKLIINPVGFFEGRLAKNLFVVGAHDVSQVQRIAVREAAGILGQPLQAANHS